MTAYDYEYEFRTDSTDWGRSIIPDCAEEVAAELDKGRTFTGSSLTQREPHREIEIPLASPFDRLVSERRDAQREAQRLEMRRKPKDSVTRLPKRPATPSHARFPVRKTWTPEGRRWTKTVDPELFKEFEEWSLPCKFRFRARQDGRMEMIIVPVVS